MERKIPAFPSDSVEQASERGLLPMKYGTKREDKFATHQSQLEQLGDDPVEHPSVVLLVDLVCDLLHDVLCSQRCAVDLAETLWVV